MDSSFNLAITDTYLIEEARQSREYAYVPYSKFKIGAALVAGDGRVFTGCNIENSTYALTLCAERVAISKAVSEGANRILRIAVVADSEKLISPCGCCRQTIWEFSNEITEVILANLSGRVEKISIADLFPSAFDATLFNSST